MARLRAVKRQAPIVRFRFSFNLGGDGEMKGTVLVCQPEQMLEGPERPRNLRAAPTLPSPLPIPKSRSFKASLRIKSTLLVGARKVGAAFATLLDRNCSKQARLAVGRGLRPLRPVVQRELGNAS